MKRNGIFFVSPPDEADVSKELSNVDTFLSAHNFGPGTALTLGVVPNERAYPITPSPGPCARDPNLAPTGHPSKVVQLVASFGGKIQLNTVSGSGPRTATWLGKGLQTVWRASL